MPAVDTALLAAVQDVAVRHRAWRGSDKELLALIVPHMPEASDDTLTRLRRDDVQEELRLRDIIVWAGHDRAWRVIDASPPATADVAVRFMEAAPLVVGRHCIFCKMDEDTAVFELIDIGPATWIHLPCRGPWFRWRRCAAAAMERERIAKQTPHAWWQALELDSPNATTAEIEAAYKRVAQRVHPDKAGGDNKMMERLNRARSEALLPRKRGRSRA